MKTKRVIVNNGYQNLFKISETNGMFTISQIIVGLFLDKTKKIGTAKNFDDALSIVKSYSGAEVKEIKEW